MSDFLNDTFTAANGTAISGRTASPTGGVWTATGLGTSSATIESNRLKHPGGGTSLNVYNNQVAGGQDYTVLGAAYHETGSDWAAYLGVRFDSSAQSGYLGGHQGLDRRLDIYKVVGGTPSLLAQGSTYSSSGPANGETWNYVVHVTKVGSTAVIDVSAQRPDGQWLKPDGTWQSSQIVGLTYTDSSSPIEPTNGGYVWTWLDEGNSYDSLSSALDASALASGTLSNTALGSTTATNVATAATGGTSPYTYQWYRSTTSGFTPGGGNILSGATSLTLNDTGLTASTTYYYKVISTDNVGATVTSSQLSITTTSGALASGSLSNTALGTTTATNVATAATGGTSPYTYQWYRSTSSGFTPGGGNILSGATSLTLNDTGLSASTTYYYKVVSTDNVSATVTSSQLSITTNSASAVASTILTATPSETAVVLTLTASGGTAPYSTSFYRSTTANFTPGVGNIIGTVTGATPSFGDTTAAAGTLYYYRAIVTDAAASTITLDAVGGQLLKASVRMVFIGDSNTYGANTTTPGGATAPPAYAATIVRGKTSPRAVVVSNQGHSGSTSADWVSGQAYLTSAKSAMTGLSGTIQAFFIAIGTNDTVSPVSKAAYKANVSSTIDDLRSAFPSSYIFLNCPIYTSPGTNNGTSYPASGIDFISLYRDALAELVSEKGDPLTLIGDNTAWEAFADHTADWYATETFSSGTHSGERFYLHTNDLGAQQWAELLVTRLCNTLNGTTGTSVGTRGFAF